MINAAIIDRQDIARKMNDILRFLLPAISLRKVFISRVGNSGICYNKIVSYAVEFTFGNYSGLGSAEQGVFVWGI